MEEISLELYRKELVNKQCRRVTKNDKIGPLIEQMLKLLEQHGGTGLSAPQVGVYFRIAIIASPTLNLQHVLVNPEIVNLAGKDLLESESCLSLPPLAEAKARVWRSEIVHVRGGTINDPDAERVTVYRGSAARAVQHELDHLNGVFFINRCQPVGRGIVLRAYEKFLQEGNKL